MNNVVRVYKNGLAVIYKGYALEPGKVNRLSIPVKKDDLGDLISSLTIWGPVDIIDVPTFKATNAEDSILSLNTTNVIKEFATKLIGAEVAIFSGTKIEGILCGIETDNREFDGKVIEDYSIVLLTKEGVKSVKSYSNIVFKDKEVQEELNKYLKQKIQSIKPNSHFVDLSVRLKNSKLESGECCVSYTIPVAAWKTRYQIRMTEDSCRLEAHAIVDNDTEDSWDDVNLYLVDGESINFSTDIAEIKRPIRNKVNVVSDFAIGAEISSKMRRRKTAGIRSLGADGFESYGTSNEMLMSMQAEEGGTSYEIASQLESEISEVGDSSVYDAPNKVTIPAKKSAIVNLFGMELSERKLVLIYKAGKNLSYPYRSLKFKNSARHSLPAGICLIYLDGDCQGKCIFEQTVKPNEETFLIYSLETGVRISKETSNIETQDIGMYLANGTVRIEKKHVRETAYKIKNLKKDKFELEIEHVRNWNGSKLEVFRSDKSKDVLIKDERVYAPLKSDEEFSIIVRETYISSQSVGLTMNFVFSNIVATQHPLLRNKNLEKLLKLQDNHNLLSQKIKEFVEEEAVLDQEIERLIKLIASVDNDSYRSRIVESEKALTSIKKDKLPSLRKDLQNLQNEINHELGNLETNWNA